MNRQFAKRLSINQAFTTNGIKMHKNLKALLMKATKAFDSKTERDILNSINESLATSHSIVIKGIAHRT